MPEKTNKNFNGDADGLQHKEFEGPEACFAGKHPIAAHVDNTDEKKRKIQTREFTENNPNFGASGWKKVVDTASCRRYKTLNRK